MILSRKELDRVKGIVAEEKYQHDWDGHKVETDIQFLLSLLELPYTNWCEFLEIKK